MKDLTKRTNIEKERQYLKDIIYLSGGRHKGFFDYIACFVPMASNILRYTPEEAREEVEAREAVLKRRLSGLE